MAKAAPRSPFDDPLFESYAQLAASLVEDLSGVCLLDGASRLRGVHGNLSASDVLAHLEALKWNGAGVRAAAVANVRPGQWLTVIPIEQTDGVLVGVFCVQQALPQGPTRLNRHAEETAVRLKPLLDCVRRQLIESQPRVARIQTLTDRTSELEWLFKVTGALKEGVGDGRAIQELLAAATTRLHAALGVLEVPDKRLFVEHTAESTAPDGGRQHWDTLRGVWRQTRPNLLNWVHRQNQPLVVNSAGKSGNAIPRCKILAVPLARDAGRVMGFLAFYNPPFAEDFSSRHVYLARHLGRQAAAVVDAQFDLMTGLYTRSALGQSFAAAQSADDAAAGSLIYIDVDHMHVINETHGFELGNELIVRIADLLAQPLVPATGETARLSGDRFAIALPQMDPQAAAQLAGRIGAAVKALELGPDDDRIEASISCGVAALVAMPDGLDRAIAAAEIACKTAKGRGRDRVELYASEDHSMMQRRNDVLHVGRLRAALKAERFLLYAERLQPLNSPVLPGGFDIDLRLRHGDGTAVSPEELITAAERYQLMPSVDRWTVKHALQTLALYRGMLQSSGLWVVLRLSGQSLADSGFVEHLITHLTLARLPPDCLWVMLSEQAAAKHFVHASALVERLRPLGCRLALDGLGMGTHALEYLSKLSIARVRIGNTFPADLAAQVQPRHAVRALTELAAGLGIQTLAGRVDSAPLAETLRELRVDFACGTAFGAAEPLETLLRRQAADESQRLRRLYLEM